MTCATQVLLSYEIVKLALHLNIGCMNGRNCIYLDTFNVGYFQPQTITRITTELSLIMPVVCIYDSFELNACFLCSDPCFEVE